MFYSCELKWSVACSEAVGSTSLGQAPSLWAMPCTETLQCGAMQDRPFLAEELRAGRLDGGQRGTGPGLARTCSPAQSYCPHCSGTGHTGRPDKLPSLSRRQANIWPQGHRGTEQTGVNADKY